MSLCIARRCVSDAVGRFGGLQVQILAWVLSYSPAHNVDSLALLASSAALLASPIPFDTPIAGVAVGMDSEGNLVVNPTREALRSAPSDTAR
jgi:polyribonucleotide nucleotidyltransferase